MLLRGPILVGAVVTSILCSVLKSLSWCTIAQMSLLILGCAISCYDSANIGHHRFRRYVKTQLEGIVWDDVMYKFFHPDFVWYKYFTETLLGQAAWVYAFPATPTQRRQLLQSTLNIPDEEEARRILFAPGGYQELLLPQSFLKWLKQDGTADTSCNLGENRAIQSCVGQPENREKEVGNEMAGDAASSSSSVSGQASEKESAINFEASEISFPDITGTLTSEKCTTRRNEKKTSEWCAPSQTASPPTAPVPSVKDTMQSIIFETLSSQFQDLLAFTPDKKQTAALGLVAAASLALQLRYSKRSRNIALGFLEASSVAGLSAITMGAGSLFLAKSTFETGSFQLDAKSLVPYIKTLLSWKKAVTDRRTNRASDDSNDRWRKIYYAGAILLLFSLRHSRQRRQQYHR